KGRFTLERAQSKALRIITGAVKTTPITDMQSYTSNPVIAIEIKKKAVYSLKGRHRIEYNGRMNANQVP
ncbi:hypothetical protein TNCT_255841, partial [Trichonephila clavata]